MPPRSKQTQQSNAAQALSSDAAAHLLEVINDKQPEETPWQALLQHLMPQTRMNPIDGDEAPGKAVLKQLCGLLSHVDTSLAAAAASAIASFYAVEGSCIYIWPVIARHIRDVGAVLGEPAAVAQMVATGPPFAVGHLTLLAASSVKIFDGRHEAIASALLPGLMPALVLACKYREVEYSICIVSCAELALAAAQLAPPAGTAAAEHLSSPRLQHQALRLATAALSCMDKALDVAPDFDEEGRERTYQLACLLARATTAAMGALHHLTTQRLIWSSEMANGLLALFAGALSHVHAGVSCPYPERSAVLAGCCQMLWLCSGYLLPLAVQRGSSDLVMAVSKAAMQVLRRGAQESGCFDGSTRPLLLVTARVVRIISHLDRSAVCCEQASAVRRLLAKKVLPLLDVQETSSLQGSNDWPLPHAWQPAGNKQHSNVSRDLDITVLLADELVRTLALFVHYAFLARLPNESRLPGGMVPGGFAISSLVLVVDARVVEVFAAFMLGHHRSKPRRLNISKRVRVPDEENPVCKLAAERSVAAAALQIVEACIAAAAASEQQLRHSLQAVGHEEEVGLLRAHFPEHATAAASVGLAHLVLELREFHATRDAAYLDVMWQRLQPLLAALAGGGGGDATAAWLLKNVDSFFSLAATTTVPAAMYGRGDVVAGLCGLLERLLRRDPLAAEHLRPTGWPLLWQQSIRQLRAKAGRRVLAGVQPAIASVTAALQRAVQQAYPQESDPQLQQQRQRQQQVQRRQQGGRGQNQQPPAADAAAAVAAANRMAALLLQEDDAEKQQLAARAARKKRRPPSSDGAPAAPAAAAAAGTSVIDAAPTRPGAGGTTGAPPASAASVPHLYGCAAEAAAEPAADEHAWMLCPLTQVAMLDPVLLPADGQSYERPAIEEWLHQRGTSPLTGQPADAATLMPNFALRSLLQALARRH